MADVQIKISVDSKQAQDNLKKTGDIGKKAADQINIGFSSVTSAFKVFQGALAANVVQSAFGYMTQAVTEFKNVMGEALTEAQAQEDANNALSNTMKIMGDYTNKAWKEMVDLSNQLAETTTNTDDQVISSLNLAKSLGLSNEQAIKVVKSAADLAAMKNIPLDEAVAGLGKSLTGTAGRLAMLIPQVKDFTAEQLKAGAALEYVNNNMGGSAAAKLNTFSGQVTQTKKAWGELLETLGMIVIKNPEVLTVISDLGSSFVKLTKYVSDNAEGISSYISEAIVKLRDNVKSAAKVIDALSEAAGGNSKKLEEVGTASYIAASEFEKWGESIGAAVGILGGLYLATTTTAGGVSVLGGILTTVATGGVAALGAAIATTVATVGVFLAQIALVVVAVGGLAYVIKKGMENFYESTDAYKEHTKALEESRKSYEQVKTPLVDYRSEMDKNTDSMLNQLGLLKEFSFYPEEIKKKVIIEEESKNRKIDDILALEEEQLRKNAKIKAEARELERQAMLESNRRTQQEIALINQENDAIMALEARARRDENFASDLEAQRQFQVDKESIQMEYLNKRLALDKTESKNSKKNTDERNKLLKEQNKRSLEDHKALNNQRIQSDAAVNTAAVNGAFSVANAMIAASNMGAGTAFALTKALLIAQTIMSGYAAQMLASATIPPPAGPIIGAGLLTQAYINAGAIAAVALIQLNAGQGKKGGYENGGIVPGSSFTGDRVTANVNSGEMILNKQQQARLFEQANGRGVGASSSGIIDAINSLGNRIANMEIVLHADGEQIARAANRGYASGIVIGAT